MELKEFLKSIKSSYPYLSRDDAERIISEVLRIPRLDLALNETKGLTKSEITEIDLMLFKRAENLPLQYIFGEAHFRNLILQVGEGVLIPKPETETLVDLSLSLLKEIEEPEVCDTGSGAIALAIGAENQSSLVKGVDISREALKYARNNIVKNKIGNVDFIYGDLLTPFEKTDTPHKFDLITANLPYVSQTFYDDLPPEVKDYEPQTALLSGEDGLDLIRKVAKSAKQHLLPEGHIIFEFSPEQEEQMRLLLREHNYSEIRIEKDLNGLARFAIGKK